jgi:uncharacterized protein (DUF362 family)
MGQDWYGSIDFTKICRLWRDHKELFQMVEFKDGQHALLKCNFNERQQPDDHGNTHYLQAACKKADRKEGVNYYISSGFKPSQSTAQSSSASPEKAAEPVNDNDLPF